MKKYLLILFSFLSVQLFAQDTQTPAQITREVKTGKASLLKGNGADGYYGEVRDSSEMLLFEYRYTAAQKEHIADDEYLEMLSFNIQPDKTGKFLLSGDDLKNAQGFFYKSCFCADRGSFLMVSGKIRGAKMSKTTWYINVDVMVNVKSGDSQKLVNKKVKGYFTIIPQH